MAGQVTPPHPDPEGRVGIGNLETGVSVQLQRECLELPLGVAAWRASCL